MNVLSSENLTPILKHRLCGAGSGHCRKIGSPDCVCNRPLSSSEPTPTQPSDFAGAVRAFADAGMPKATAVQILVKLRPDLHQEWLANGGGHI